MSTDDLELYKKVMTEHGNSLTRTRETVFKILIGPEPQSMNMIVSKVKGRVDRVSVYRSIELFEKIGLAHRITTGWKYKIELSDQFNSHHHHLSCLGCSKTIDIEDEQHIDQFIKTVTDKHGFQVRRHQFEIDGYCNDCLVKADASRSGVL